jgi:hypothetical protein
MDKATAEAAVQKYGSQTKAAAGLGCSRKVIRKALGWATAKAQAPASALSRKTVAIAAVLEAHDKVADTLKAIRDIPAGEVMVDDDLRREVGAGADRWRRIRGSARLAGLWFALPGNSTVWGQRSTIAALAERMKEIL